jgi:hypothetical protein
MFDFWKFHKDLINKTNYFIDDYWDQFPKGHNCRYKEKTLSLLKDNVAKKNRNDLPSTLAIIFHDGADKDYTDILLQLLDEKWHESEEDIISILELIKDPKSVDKLYEVAINIPDYDDMRGVAKKCMWALSAIRTTEAVQKLEMLEKNDDPIISENATFQLKHL